MRQIWYLRMMTNKIGKRDLSTKKMSEAIKSPAIPKLSLDEELQLTLNTIHSMNQNRTGDRLKEYESWNEPNVPSELPYIIRLDGVSFSKFTKGMVKPFDDRLSQAMIKTTEDLVLKFNAVLGYTISDEISLVFLAAGPMQVHTYNGRTQKLASITASYTSARFNYNLMRLKPQWEIEPLIPPKTLERLLSHTGHFDARVIPLPDPSLITETIFWRSSFDGIRNGISHIGHSYYSQKELQGASVVKVSSRLQTEKNIHVLRDYDYKHLFGSWIKREQYQLHNCINPVTGHPVDGPVLRTRLRTDSWNWGLWREKDRIDYTMATIWNGFISS